MAPTLGQYGRHISSAVIAVAAFSYSPTSLGCLCLLNGRRDTDVLPGTPARHFVAVIRPCSRQTQFPNASHRRAGRPPEPATMSIRGRRLCYDAPTETTPDEPRTGAFPVSVHLSQASCRAVSALPVRQSIGASGERPTRLIGGNPPAKSPRLQHVRQLRARARAWMCLFLLSDSRLQSTRHGPGNLKPRLCGASGYNSGSCHTCF
jgi:hypothetical protein